MILFILPKVLYQKNTIIKKNNSQKSIKLILCFIVFALFSSCKSSKQSGYTDTAFKQYLIDTNKMDKDAVINDSYYDKYYSDYYRNKKKKHITNNQYLKTNQVYTYLKSNKSSYIFSVFSDDGQLYTGTYVIGSEYLSAPDNGIIKLKRPIELSSFADFEIQNDILKVKRNVKTPFKEWNENDTG